MSSSSSSSDSRGAVSVEQLVGECFVKTAQVVLSARVLDDQDATSRDPKLKRKSWFKLEVEEVQSAKPSLERWRAERNLGLPLVLEIYLQPMDQSGGAQARHADAASATGTLLERWQVHYTPLTTMPLPLGGMSRSQLARYSPLDVYKRLTLLVLSLYTYVRVLPAYRLHRVYRRQPYGPFRLAHRIHSSLASQEVATKTKMERFTFSPVETADGHFHVSVDYHPASTVRVMGQAVTRLPRAPFINYEYVGGGSGAVGAAVPGAVATRQHTARIPKLTLQPAPSSPASLEGTPRRRSWSSSFRLSPARSPGSPSPGTSPLPGSIATNASGGSPSPRSTTAEAAQFRPSSLPARSASTPIRWRGASSGRPPLPPTALSPSASRSASTGERSPLAQVAGGRLYVDRPVEEGFEGTEGGAGGEGWDGEVGVDIPERQTEEVEGNSPTDSAGRPLSAPMQIPLPAGTAHRGHHRLRTGLKSSGDIRALQKPQQVKPLSAPAVSHMPQAMLGGVEDVAGGRSRGSQQTESRGVASSELPQPSVPVVLPTPAATGAAEPTAMPSPTDSAGSSQAAPFPASFPASCSPDFPFAFTPSGNYSFSPGASGTLRAGPPLLDRTSSSSTSPSPRHSIPGHKASPSGTSGGALMLPPPSPVQGREVPASTALLRRTSWGGRSISGDASSAIGYSVSPMPDAGLESLLLSASTPRQFVLGSSASGFRPGSSPASGVALVGAVTPRRVDPLLLTFPSGGSSGGVPEELPFAFAEDLSSSRVHALPAALDHGMRDGKGRSSDSSGEGGEAGTPGEAGDAAGVAALGTFMALVRDAKPLSGLTATNLEAGLAQLERVSVSLAAHGVK